jgi:hypothetical protein
MRRPGSTPFIVCEKDLILENTSFRRLDVPLGQSAHADGPRRAIKELETLRAHVAELLSSLKELLPHAIDDVEVSSGALYLRQNLEKIDRAKAAIANTPGDVP